MACCPTMEEFRNPASPSCVPRLSDDGFIAGCDATFRSLPDDPDADEYPDDDDPAKVVRYCPWCGTHLATGSAH